MKRFNPNQWKEVTHNEEIPVKGGLLQVMCSHESPVYVTSKDGIQALAGVGTSITVTGEFASFYVESDVARVFVLDPLNVVHESTGEILSSAERQPVESGTVQAIKQATREFQLMQSSAMKAMQKAEAARKAAEKAKQPEVEPTPEPDPKEVTEENVKEDEETS
jgi:hypothetical protein